MNLDRRTTLQFLMGLSITTLAGRLSPIASATGPLHGINAYYLLVESYRQIRKKPTLDQRKVILNYLRDDLGLARLRERSRVNAIRFWAFNDYPQSAKRVSRGAFDASLWPKENAIDQQVLEILACLIECLTELEFYLVPVLSNYWIAYGGILRYLEWAGHITSQSWLEAFCDVKDQELYLKYSADFYLLPAVERIFQAHVLPVVQILQKSSKVVIVDVMNEPRGKSQYSIENQPVQNDRYAHQLVAQWLNRQALFLRRYLPAEVDISSGEEGWLVTPVEQSLQYLKNESQSQEGIDLKTNLQAQDSALTLGSVHLYAHAAAELAKVNACGVRFIDRRGWDFLLQSQQSQDPDSYIKLGEEWLHSRSEAIANQPWYLGEMGWCRPHSPNNLAPLPASVLQAERINIYRQWTEQAFELGARGVFLWMLNGLQHQDEFYGLNGTQIAEIYPR